MVGLEAIAHHNGWSMALAGACIVLSGLAILAFIISQLHKLVRVIEKREAPPPAVQTSGAAKPGPPAAKITAPDRCPVDLKETAQLYRPLASELGEPFQLAELYAMANRYRFPHPHITIRCLREAGLLISLGDGKFRLTE